MPATSPLRNMRPIPNPASGKYVGVGLVTEMDSSGYLLVREVYPDSPAQMAGIKVGALITNVNGTRVTENNNESMAGRLRGEAGHQGDSDHPTG